MTGLYYYEKRYYDPNKSTFLAVDPLAEKYSSLSPYAYCANNPLRYIDPDGMQIVDAEGNVIYQKNNDGWDWTDKATDDAKAIASAMKLSPVGRENFYTMAESDIPIELIYNTTDNDGSLGRMDIYYSATEFKIVKAKLIIYDQAINERVERDQRYREANNNYPSSYLHAGVSNRMKNNNFTKFEIISAVSSHEFGHFDHPLGNQIFNPIHELREEIADYYQHKAISSILEHRLNSIDVKPRLKIKPFIFK